MPAQVCHQDPQIKELFHRAIRAKLESVKNTVMNNFDDEVPWWAAWALRPLVSVTHDLLNARDRYVGGVVEGKAAASLHLVLTRECTLINDVVLEVEPDEFIQVDHVVVAPSGVFLVETKAWRGAFVCYGGTWRRKSGKSWERCKSPTWQNKRHQELFQRWISREVSGLPAGNWARPIVLFTSASYLKTDGLDIPVFDSCLAMAWWIRKWAAGSVLGEAERQRIVAAVVNAKPADRTVPRREQLSPPEPPKTSPVVEEGKTRQGASFVRVRGTKTEAEDVRREYVSSGKKPGEVKADRREKGVWYFYVG